MLVSSLHRFTLLILSLVLLHRSLKTASSSSKLSIWCPGTTSVSPQQFSPPFHASSAELRQPNLPQRRNKSREAHLNHTSLERSRAASPRLD